MSDAARAEVGRLTCWRRPLLKWLVGQGQQGFALRDAGKSGMVASLLPMRHLLFDIGRRLVTSGHMQRAEQVFPLSKPGLLVLLRG